MRSHRKIARLISISLVLLVFVSTLVKTPQVAAQESASELQREEDFATLEGVVTVEMTTDKGQIKLMQPSVILPGDTISGAVIDERKDVQASDELSGAVVEINDQKQKLHNGILTFVVPAAAGSIIPFILKNKTGREIARGKIPVNQTGLSGSIPTQLGNFSPPRIGQTGRDLCVSGRFDGQADTTQISVGNQQAEFLAESPRMSAVKIPANAPTGPTMLTIEEVFNVNGRVDQVREQFKFNTLSVELKADKLHLLRGESTNLHVAVRGLEGMEDYKGKIALELQNLSPDVVRFTRSTNLKNHRQQDTQYEMLRKAINPSEMSDGILTLNQNLIGVRAGAFLIRATLRAFLQDEPKTPRDWVRRIAELKRQAANQSDNTKNKKELEKNADDLDKLADNDDNWDDDDQPESNKKFKDAMKKEKDWLDKAQKRENKDSEAWKKIGEAKDAVDKAVKAAK